MRVGRRDKYNIYTTLKESKQDIITYTCASKTVHGHGQKVKNNKGTWWLRQKQEEVEVKGGGRTPCTALNNYEEERS